MTTKKINRLNASGFSLIEVMASILILSIILISVFSLLIQSGKTTSNSEKILDATYLAQTEMEQAYEVAQKNSVTNSEQRIEKIREGLNYPSQTPTTEGDRFIIEKTVDAKTQFLVRIELWDDNTYSQLSPILIKVYEKRNGEYVLKAQMENTLAWGG